MEWYLEQKVEVFMEWIISTSSFTLDKNFVGNIINIDGYAGGVGGNNLLNTNQKKFVNKVTSLFTDQFAQRETIKDDS